MSDSTDETKIDELTLEERIDRVLDSAAPAAPPPQSGFTTPDYWEGMTPPPGYSHMTASEMRPYLPA